MMQTYEFVEKVLACKLTKECKYVYGQSKS